MVFTVIFNCLLIFVCLIINLEFNASFDWVISNLGGYFGRNNYHLLQDVDSNKQATFCREYIS
jgi:hypothetical protein